MKSKVRREWIKIHLICGTRTHIVTSVIATGGHVGDSLQFGRLVKRTAQNFRMAEVSADKAYLAGENMLHAYRAGATPFIPFKSRCRLDADYKSTLWKRMLHMYRFRRPEYLEHYYKRNNVETTFSMIKAKFGERLLSKSQRGQFNEALCKVLCHNLCVLVQLMYSLNITPQFVPGDLSFVEHEDVSDELIGGRIVAGVRGPRQGPKIRVMGRKAHPASGGLMSSQQLSLFDKEAA
jgi:hypothetical protein